MFDNNLCVICAVVVGGGMRRGRWISPVRPLRFVMATHVARGALLLATNKTFLQSTKKTKSHTKNRFILSTESASAGTNENFPHTQIHGTVSGAISWIRTRIMHKSNHKTDTIKIIVYFNNHVYRSCESKIVKLIYPKSSNTFSIRPTIAQHTHTVFFSKYSANLPSIQHVGARFKVFSMFVLFFNQSQTHTYTTLTFSSK